MLLPTHALILLSLLPLDVVVVTVLEKDTSPENDHGGDDDIVAAANARAYASSCVDVMGFDMAWKSYKVDKQRDGIRANRQRREGKTTEDDDHDDDKQEDVRVNDFTCVDVIRFDMAWKSSSRCLVFSLSQCVCFSVHSYSLVYFHLCRMVRLFVISETNTWLICHHQAPLLLLPPPLLQILLI